MSCYLITGASGTLGTALTLRLLAEGHKVRGLSRNEHRLQDLEQKIPQEQRSNFSPIMGDVEQPEDLLTAFNGVDYVIHGAAAKVVPMGEYNARKFKRTNVDGSDNVAHACIRAGVIRAVLVSSDKACAPSTLYGQTKAAAERVWLCSNRLTGGWKPYFMAVRYGNVFASQGSVIHAWKKQGEASKGISLTDPQCTRFHITLAQAVSFVLEALENAHAGELWVPRLPSYRIGDLAHSFRSVYGLHRQPEIAGLRLSEKLHESMISSDEWPSLKAEDESHYTLEPGVIHRKERCEYSSGSNTWRLGVEALTEEIRAWAERS
jgi:FlaA1/EpsC-like NDP-sugar epimerase